MITRGFIGGGFSNNACKRHLKIVMAVEGKKVKPNDQEKGQVISFSNEDYYEGFDRDHDNLMVIIVTVHNYVIKRILVD